MPFMKSLIQIKYIDKHDAKIGQFQLWPLRDKGGQNCAPGGQNVKPRLFWEYWPKNHIWRKEGQIKKTIFFYLSEVKIWLLKGQNGKLMPFLKSLTQKTYILIYMMQKRSNFSFDLLEVKMTSGRSKFESDLF